MAAATNATPASIKKRFIVPPLAPATYGRIALTQHRRRGRVNSVAPTGPSPSLEGDAGRGVAAPDHVERASSPAPRARDPRRLSVGRCRRPVRDVDLVVRERTERQQHPRLRRRALLLDRAD